MFRVRASCSDRAGVKQHPPEAQAGNISMSLNQSSRILAAKVYGNFFGRAARPCEACSARLTLINLPCRFKLTIEEVTEPSDFGSSSLMNSSTEYVHALVAALSTLSCCLTSALARKQNVGFAPVFQPMLGPIDEAAERLLLIRLGRSVPEDVSEQRAFFELTAAAQQGKGGAYLAERARTLKRLLIDHSPISAYRRPPLLCRIPVPRTGEQSPAGVFGAVDREFEKAPVQPGWAYAVNRVYNFRNTCIAHEKGEELISEQNAEEALRQWIGLLRVT